jgi:hypothetical protein
VPLRCTARRIVIWSSGLQWTRTVDRVSVAPVVGVKEPDWLDCEVSVGPVRRSVSV